MISTLCSIFLLLSGAAQSDSVEIQTDSPLAMGRFQTEVFLSASPYHHSLRLAPQVTGQLDLSNRSGKFSPTPLVSLGIQHTIGRVSLGYAFSSTFPFRPELSIYNRARDKIGEGLYSVWQHDVSVAYRFSHGITLGAGWHLMTSRIRDFRSRFTTPFAYELTDHGNLYVTLEKAFRLNRLTVVPSVKYSLRQWMDEAPTQYICRRGSPEAAHNGELALTSPAKFYAARLELRHEALGPVRLSVTHALLDHRMIDLSQTMITLSYHHLFEWIDRY